MDHRPSRDRPTRGLNPAERELPAKISRYLLHGELGRGGMGVVYEAHDPELGRQVAIKVILFPAQASDATRAELEERFRREARAAGSIHHPGVVTVHDVGCDGEFLFLVMELVAGVSLAAQLQRGPRPQPHEALDIVAQVAEALAAAHAQGVVHRDVTPRNILLAPAGRVVVTDFGIARGFGAETSQLTHTGAIIGSPSYISPEQARGQAVDERADLFSLGVVLFEMLVGRRPFASPDLTSVLYQIVHEDPLAAPDIQTSLNAEVCVLLQRCLAKSPDQRPRGAAELASEARRLRDEMSALASGKAAQTTVAFRSEKLQKSRARRWSLAALLLAIVVIVAGTWLALPEQEPASAKRLAADKAAAAGAISPEPASVASVGAELPSVELPSPLSAAEVKADSQTAAIKPAAAPPGEIATPPRRSPLPAAEPEQSPSALAPAADNGVEGTPPAGPPPDTVAPVLAIDDPPVSISGSLLVLTGRVLDDRGAVRLSVDDEVVEVQGDGQFTVRRQLSPGRNVFTFLAVDEAGNRSARLYEVAPVAAAPAGDEAATQAAAGPPVVDQLGGRQGPPPRSRFVDRGDGTLVDAQVQLMWTKRGDGKSHTWKDARRFCKKSSLAEHRDWRLPSIEELEDLFQASTTGNGLILARQEAVWSSTKKSSNAAWAFDFATGRRVEQAADGAELDVVCVRRLPGPSLPRRNERGFPPDPRRPGGGG